MLDYIVVGLGLSGLAVSEELIKRNKNFVVFEDNSQNSSYVAGGLFNPVILKRFTPAWNAAEQLKLALPFYEELERKLQVKLIHKWSIYRRFHSPEEQNNWFAASDNPQIEPFLDSQLHKNTNPNVNAAYSFGKVLGTGNIDTTKLLDTYRDYIQFRDCFKQERLVYEELQIKEDHVQYRDILARKIIFCEGFGLKKNPYFGYLPIQGNKGEYITVYSDNLKLNHAIKSSVFILPLGDDLYKVGATYDHSDKSPVPTTAAREKLVKQLRDVVNCDFEVVDQVAGIRPAVSDRRPILGVHPEHSILYCCNGFGSRGVLIAPSMAPQLLAHIEEGRELEAEVDIQRFTKKYYKKA